MSNTSPQHIAGNIGAIFAQLKQQDVEEFYIGYQYWNLQHQIEALQIRLDDLRKQIIVNTERMQEVQPTAIELATLARLQSNGVSDVDLLDRMLKEEELVEATEELFLQKISNDEDEALMQAITMKRPSITVADLEESVPSSEDTRAAVEVTPTLEHTTPAKSTLAHVSPKRPNFMTRFFGKIWGS